MAETFLSAITDTELTKKKRKAGMNIISSILTHRKTLILRPFQFNTEIIHNCGNKNTKPTSLDINQDLNALEKD